jgi:hypothetical protein
MKYLLSKKLVKRIFLGLILSVSFACNQHSISNEALKVRSLNNLSNKNSNNENPNESQNHKIIKSANSKCKVKNVKITTQKIKNFVKHYKGYVSELQFRNNLQSIENNFTIKVPQEHFELIMDSIRKSVAFIEYENISTQDVTEEYIDLETRLKTKKEVKRRYENILRKSAKTVKDILLTEEKMRIIQEEIEATVGRLNYLKNRVSYSSIEIILYETVHYTVKPNVYKKGFWTKTKEGFYNGGDIISTIVLGLVNIWPILFIAIGVLFYIRKKK